MFQKTCQCLWCKGWLTGTKRVSSFLCCTLSVVGLVVQRFRFGLTTTTLSVSLLYDEHCCMDEAYKGPESKGLQIKVLTAQKGLQVGRVVTKDQSVGWTHGN